MPLIINEKMQIDYLYYLPEAFKATATQVYFNALREKLEPILGNDHRAQDALSSNLATDKCLVAICDGKLVGIMGIQSNKGGFINPNLKSMTRIYGIFGGMLRVGGLAMLNHTTRPDELYVDGVAVVNEMRGKGIGSHLFGLLERKALKDGIRRISLEVIETNTRAKALYKHLGFVESKTQTLWPLNLFLEFPFRSATLMTKTVGR